MVEINIPLGDVRYKGDPHAVTGKMIGRDLLVQLQRHMGRKTCAF